MFDAFDFQHARVYWPVADCSSTINSAAFSGADDCACAAASDASCGNTHAVLAAMGLTVWNAFRIMLTRVAHEKALPFEPLVPNHVTIEVMKEARRGNLETVTLNEIQAVLDADD